MSKVKIEAALKQRLLSFAPQLPTKWENVTFAPQPNEPYQRVWFLYAEPENPAIGSSFKREKGYMQIDLLYPINVGTGEATQRGENLQNWFNRGLSFEYEGVIVKINKSPSLSKSPDEEGFYKQVLKVWFYSDIGV